MIYLDSSALLKVVLPERESAALREWLRPRIGTPMVSSELARVEVLRACHRVKPAAVTEARTLLGQLDLVPLRGEVIGTASDLPDPLLRSLDALHLASALSLGSDLTTFVAYDQRLLDAADRAGLDTCRPAD